jgi:regulatory protein|tara:strand:- start:19989 stop:20438 length:450 start_codon:yes stop_codon:yes gene_type:complete
LKKLIKNQDIRKKLLDLLSRREHSKYEIFNKLKYRVESEEELNKEIHKLTEENLQSDLRFSESFIRSRYNSGFGPVRIKYDLSSRKVLLNIIEKAFEEVSLDWEEKLLKENLKKYGEMPPSNLKELSKRLKFFTQRGFEQDIIRKLIKF